MPANVKDRLAQPGERVFQRPGDGIRSGAFRWARRRKTRHLVDFAASREHPGLELAGRVLLLAFFAFLLGVSWCSPASAREPESPGAGALPALAAMQAQPPRPPQLALRGGVLSDLVSYPRPQLGPALSVLLTEESLRFEAEAAWLGTPELRIARTQPRLRFWSGLANVRGCVLWRPPTPWLVWAGCVGAQGGVAVASELGPQPTRHSAAWLAGELGAGPTLALSSRLQTHLRLSAIVPATRHRFVFSDAAASYRTARATLQIELGVSFDLPDAASTGR
jgi:hypothetical protein